MTRILKIVSARKEILQETKEPFLDIGINIYEKADDGSETLVEEKKFAYPFATPVEDIKADLTKCLATSISDAEMAIANQLTEQLNKQADETIASLEGAVIE
jgi:hypothetical protein